MVPDSLFRLDRRRASVPDHAQRPPSPFDTPLSPKEHDLVARAEIYAAEIIAPNAAGWEQRREALPREAFLRYGRDGFSGLRVPEALGGQGVSFFCKLRVAEAMARTCMAAAFALTNSQGTQFQLARVGTPEQQERYLPCLLSGALVSAPSLTEPGAGSDVTAMATTATRVGGGWRIDGTKAWVTNGVLADLLVLYAQTAPGSGAKGIASFLVDLRSPGVRRTSVYRMIGGSATGAAEIAFDGVFVPERDVISAAGQTFRNAMQGIIAARVHVAAMVNATVAECLDRAVDHAGSRRAFGRRLMEHQGLRWSLADVSLQLEASRLLTWKAAALVNEEQDATFEAAQAKAFAASMAAPAVSACMQAMGAIGLTDEHPFARHLAAARIAAYVDGTTEIQRDRVGAMLARRYGKGTSA